MADEAMMSMRNLKRDIIVILSLKISIVMLAALLVFGPRQRPAVDGEALNRQILNHSYK